MAIKLLLVYARSGGTLFNQCLAAMPNTFVISEVSEIRRDHTLAREVDTSSIWGQAKQWYDISLQEPDFIDAILELEAHCIKQSKTLIIRDWTFASFSPCKENQLMPSLKLDTYLKLYERTQVTPFVLVRNTIDVWISRGRPELGLFNESYRNYVDQVLSHQFKIYKYEDLCNDPDTFLKDVCSYLKIPFDFNYRKLYLLSKVNGDVQLGDKSRGNRQGVIKPLKRKFIYPHNIIKLAQDQSLNRINKFLGYENAYFNKAFNFTDYLISGYKLLKHKFRF